LADFLAQSRPGARALPVVIGRDARSSSEAFQADVVAALAAAKIPVRYFAEPVPTPLVAYTARALQATAAIVITASHNPRGDNGYKLYLDDAIQLTAPADTAIEAAIAAVGPAGSVPRLEPAANAVLQPAHQSEVEPLDVTAWFERYLTEVLGHLGVPAGGPLRIAYTPLHGVGWRFAKRAFERAGFTDVRVVPEQAEPDGAFPTTPFPNPEEPSTLDIALKFAASEQADLLIANDPDADRLAVAVPTPSGRWLRLTGNQLAALLADARVSPASAGGQTTPKPIVCTSVVTTPLVEAIASSRGAHVERTLTGFKWLWTAALAVERSGAGRFAYACEEALGYSLTPAVRDKDGIAAALAIADLAARCRQSGHSLLDRWRDLGERFGIWVSAQRSVAVSGLSPAEAGETLLDRLVRSPPSTLGGRAVTEVRDFRRDAETRPRWLAAAPLVELTLDGGRILVRPSGTEPKLKFYVDLRGEAEPSRTPAATEARLADEANAIARELLAKLGLVSEDGRA
jgi:phosphomannomutase